MANLTPSAAWHWLTIDKRVALRYGISQAEVHQTPVTHVSHATDHATNATNALAFTLEHAELFWTFWHALEPLQYSEAGRFAAAIDATACVSFMQQQGQKSWHFQAVSASYRPDTTDLVLLAGQASALALVIEAGEQSSLVLLLDNILSLSGKQLTGGQAILVLNNRLIAWQPQASRHTPLLPKTA